MRIIAPKGSDTSQFPKALDIQTELAVRESNKAMNAAIASAKETRALADSVIKAHSTFFTSHFGVNTYESIKARYFPVGHSVKQGGGAGNTLAIAQEIMQFTDPAPSSVGLTVEKVVSVMNTMSRMEDLDRKVAQLTQEVGPFLRDAVYMLNKRPTAASIKAYTPPPVKLSQYEKTRQLSIPDYGLALALQRGANAADVRSIKKYGLTRGKFGDKFGGYHKPMGTYDLFPHAVLSFYVEAYKSTPEHFWRYCSVHRLGVQSEPDYPDHKTVRLYRVDPASGAPSAVGTPVAWTASANPEYILAKVHETMFPELLLLNKGFSMDSEERKTHYREDLTNALNFWKGIPDKPKTPIACVVSQRTNYDFKYSLQTQDYIQQYLKMRGGMPIAKMQIFLQPTGIETSMERILNIDHPRGNAIEKWFTTKYLQNVNASGGQYNYSKDFRAPRLGPRGEIVVKGEFQEVQEYYYAVVRCLYDVLSNPKLYSMGLSGFLNYAKSLLGLKSRGSIQTVFHTAPAQSIDIVGRDKVRDYMFGVLQSGTNKPEEMLNHIEEIFNLADWPMTAPQKLFEAAVDEQKDITLLLNTFMNYMEDNSTIAPNQIYVPESFNGKIDHKVFVAPPGQQAAQQAGMQPIQFSFIKGIIRPTTYQFKSNVVHGPAKFYGNQKIVDRPFEMLSESLFFTNTRTAVTKTKVSRSMGINFAKLPQYPTTRPTVNFSSSSYAASVNDSTMAAGVLAATTLVAGYMIIKRRG